MAAFNNQTDCPKCPLSTVCLARGRESLLDDIRGCAICHAVLLGHPENHESSGVYLIFLEFNVIPLRPACVPKVYWDRIGHKNSVSVPSWRCPVCNEKETLLRSEAHAKNLETRAEI